MFQYLTLGHPPYYKGLDYVYEDRVNLIFVCIPSYYKNKTISEKSNVSNMFNATNLFINVDITEINIFKKAQVIYIRFNLIA